MKYAIAHCLELTRDRAKTPSGFLESLGDLKFMFNITCPLIILPLPLRLDHSGKKLLPRRFKPVIPLLRVPDCDFFLTRRQALIRLGGKLVEGHANLASVFDVGLVLFVVELGCCY